MDHALARAGEEQRELEQGSSMQKKTARRLRTFHSKQELQIHTDREWLESGAIDIVDVAVILDPDMKGE